MKLFIFFSALTALHFSAGDCAKKNNNTSRYKGRLEIKGVCMNYTIRLLEGNLDTSKISSRWIDESTKKKYTNVFALGSPCNFPATIKEGDEFYFNIDSSTKQDCMVCMAYYPKPSRKLSIKVLDK